MRPIERLGFGPKRVVCEDGEGGYLVMVTPPKSLGLPTVTVPLTADQYRRYQAWERGMLLQEALHDLDAATREMLLTGLTDDEFKKAVR
jgi:hypothetical protein